MPCGWSCRTVGGAIVPVSDDGERGLSWADVVSSDGFPVDSKLIKN